MTSNYTPNGENMTGDNNNSTIDYQSNNQQYTQPPKRTGGFFSRFFIRIVFVLIIAGIFYGGSLIMNKTSLFAKTHEIEGVSIELPRGYGALDANTLQSGKDDDSFSDDNVSIYVKDNELSLSAKDYVYGYISYISDENLEIIDENDITIDSIDGHYIEYGTNATWYYEDGTSMDAYCSGIVMAIPNDDCMIVIDLYTRRGEDNRNLLSESEINRFLKFADTIVLNDSIRSDISNTVVSFGTKTLSLPESYSTIEPTSESTDFGTNYFLYADDGYKYIDYADYTISPLTAEEKQGYIDSLSEFLVEPASDNGTYHIAKYFSNSTSSTYAGVSAVYDEFVLDYYWVCTEKPSQATYDRVVEMLNTIK